MNCGWDRSDWTIEQAAQRSVIVRATDPWWPVRRDDIRDPRCRHRRGCGGRRHVFYNQSAWDGNSAAANAQDDAAIANEKQALLPGQTATFANYTSYSRGLNGLMIDVLNLTGTPTADDFLFRVGNNNLPYGSDPHSAADDWAWAPAPASITVRPGAGVDCADRVTLVWADGVIGNRWLQVTLLATDNTGLADDDVFYFGNAVGESGNSTADAVVNATDEIGVRNNPHGPFAPAPKDDVYDYNRDKLVNATDQIIGATTGRVRLPRCD